MAVEKAEDQVAVSGNLYCLGEIVHNSAEVERLLNMGVEFISRERYFELNNCRILLRAHGEPPETYRYAQENNIELIDATCPVVLKIQDKIRNAQKLNPKAQIVIYGKKDHPEVIGLNAQVEKAIIIEGEEDLNQVSTDMPVFLFAQTTKNRQKYEDIKVSLKTKFSAHGKHEDDVIVYNSICSQVANRSPWLEEFSKSVDKLVFVGGRNSSNSKMLFEVCKKNNAHSFFIANADEVINLDLGTTGKIGICGATSTPLWLIKNVAKELEKLKA